MTDNAGRVSIYTSLDEIDQASWSAVVRAAHAPVFYDYIFLKSYERFPLQQTGAFYYLVFGSPAIAVLPSYVQSTDDPLGIVSNLGLPGRSPGDLILLTHVAHCYDTVIPALPASFTPHLVEQICATLADLARQAGVKWFAFMNVDGSGALAKFLLSAGLTEIPMNTRYHKEVAAYHSVEEFVADIPSRQARFILRHSQRQAEDAGLQVTSPDPAGHPEAIELCRRTTSRHGTADYYPEQFGDFVALAADLTTVTEVRLAGKLASATICLRDASRFHLWAGGTDYAVTEKIHSSFSLMMLPALEKTISARRPVLEVGRGNATSKLRFRFEPVPLSAFIGSCESRS